MDDDALRDLFSGLGPISFRRMFGARAIYHDGLIIAFFFDDRLLLKADSETAPQFLAAGSQQWSYHNSKTGKSGLMPYWQAPQDALEDPDEMRPWARLAYQASLRSQKKPAKAAANPFD